MADLKSVATLELIAELQRRSAGFCLALQQKDAPPDASVIYRATCQPGQQAALLGLATLLHGQVHQWVSKEMLGQPVELEA